MLRDNKVLPRGDSLQQQTNNNNNIKSLKNEQSQHVNITIQSEPHEQETLLSKLDNKQIKESFTNKSIFLLACFCPCIYMGHLESKVKREKTCCDSYCNISSCQRFTFGKSGCQTCCLTAFYCSLGWPCSPLLTCHLNSQSTSISRIYDRGVIPRCTQCTLLWPKMVLQHILLYEQLEKEGRLFYDWTLNPAVLRSFQHQPFDTKDSAVLILGDKRVGKTELLMKLCHRYLYEKREESFENNEVRVGFRPMSVQNDTVVTLEFWDIPTLHLQSIHTIRARVTCILLVFDTNRNETLEEVKNVMKDVRNMGDCVQNAKYVLVAAKNDHLYHKTTHEGKFDSDPNHRKLEKAAIWAKENNMEFVSIASLFNIGVNDILKIANDASCSTPRK